MRCNKRLDPHVKRRLELNDRAGIRINKNFNSLVVEAGGVENLSFDENDYRNFIVRERQLRLGKGDRAALQDYFNRMQEKESGFFYAIDLDDDNRLRNVFWADVRSRATFEAFGDVVTFDTTYLTNKYNMPFAPFVGVNHHGNSVLLGCGLLSNEDTNTFRWLFETWLLCMGNCPPKAIITDQCKAMQNAIEIVFPDTRHRWCLWHIMKKIPEKLGGYDQYKAIKKDLKICVYETFTKDEFDDRWREMIATYDLDGNEWLKGLYAERRRWVPIYLKDTFFAGMSTTQRSESMNAFFDGYVNSKTTLKQFVEQYDNALRNKIEKENKADYHSFNSQYNCVTRYPIEKQFQEAYTNAKFSEFQVELQAKLYCHISSAMKEGPIFRCHVIEDVHLKFGNKDVVFDVYLNEEEVEVKCTCQLFEFKGILCRHSLAVLTLRKVREVPKQYILDRWRKDIKREYTRMVRGVDGGRARPQSEMQDKMFHEYLDVANVVGDSQDRCDMVISNLRNLKLEFMSSDMVGDCTQATSISESVGLQFVEEERVECAQPPIQVHSPLPKRRKGRPPVNRLMSQREQDMRRKKKASQQKDQRIETSGSEAPYGFASMSTQYTEGNMQPVLADGYAMGYPNLPYNVSQGNMQPVLADGYGMVYPNFPYNVSQVVQSQNNVSGGLTGLLLNYVQNPSQESQNFGMSFSGRNEDHHGETGD